MTLGRMSVNNSGDFYSVVDALENSAESNPTHTAITFRHTKISYRELNQLTTHLANALHATGFRVGDVALLFLSKHTPHYLIAQYGVWKAGGTTLTVGMDITTRDLYHMLQQSGANTAFVASNRYDQFKRAQVNTEARRVIVARHTDYLSRWDKLNFQLRYERAGGHRIEQRYTDMRWRDVLKLGAKAPELNVTVSAETVAQLNPKNNLAPITHHKLTPSTTEHLRTASNCIITPDF